MMLEEKLRQGMTSLWDSVAEGWQRLRRAAGALTHFKPGEGANLPARSEVDDDFYLPTHSWAILGGDMFEDHERLVVRLEVPGMEKDDFQVDVQGDELVVCGEKRFERESTEGRYRVLQCAYGRFRRVVPLPVSVRDEQATATYKNGVLRIVLPKAEQATPSKVKVD